MFCEFGLVPGSAAAMRDWRIRRIWEGRAMDEKMQKAEAARLPGRCTTLLSWPTTWNSKGGAALISNHFSGPLRICVRPENSRSSSLRVWTSICKIIQSYPNLVPSRIRSKQANARATEGHFRQAREATATARAGARSFTDYPRDHQAGVPPPQPPSNLEPRNLQSDAKTRSFASWVLVLAQSAKLPLAIAGLQAS